MMTRQILATIALLLLIETAGAVRVIEQIERPVELTLGDITFSAGGGTISFSECATCGLSTHRLTDSTVYEVNARALPLAEFLGVIEEIRDRPNGDARTVAAVFLDLASGRVTRVEVRG
jgi:hypothetical protein